MAANSGFDFEFKGELVSCCGTCGWYGSKEKAMTKLEQFQNSTVTKFVRYQRTTHDRSKSKIWWQSMIKKPQEISKARIPYDGIPYICISEEVKECQHGVDRKDKFKEERKKCKEGPSHLSDNTSKKRYLSVQNSKKKSCSAVVRIREIIKYPDYKIEIDKKKKRAKGSEKLRDDLLDGHELREEYRCYVYFPSDVSHTGHAIGIHVEIDKKKRRAKASEKWRQKIWRCCDRCDIIEAIKGEKIVKGAHWHCYLCHNGFKRQNEAIKHYKTHFRNSETSFQIQISQIEEGESLHGHSTYSVANGSQGSSGSTPQKTSPDLASVGANETVGSTEQAIMIIQEDHNLGTYTVIPNHQYADGSVECVIGEIPAVSRHQSEEESKFNRLEARLSALEAENSVLKHKLDMQSMELKRSEKERFELQKAMDVLQNAVLESQSGYVCITIHRRREILEATKSTEGNGRIQQMGDETTAKNSPAVFNEPSTKRSKTDS